MKKQVEKVITGTQVKKIVGSDSSKSQKIKDLFHGGIPVKEISVLLGIRYNFAYNVVSNMVMTSEEAIPVINKSTEGPSKKDLIIQLHREGKTNKEIAIDLKTNYNYVFNTLKAYKASQAAE